MSPFALKSATALTALTFIMGSSQVVTAQSKAKNMRLSLGGFFQSNFAFAEQRGSFESTSNSTARVGYDSFNIWNDSEIHFTGSTKLDNGIGVDVVVEIETDDPNDAATIDETYLRLKGNFGELAFGSIDGVTGTHANMAPAAGVTGPNDGDLSTVIVQPANVGVTADTLLGGSKITKLVYFSPEFNGFQAGFSIEPSDQSSSTMPAVGGNDGTDTQEYNAGLAYNGEFGGLGVTADVSYAEHHGTAASSNKGWRGGINISGGAITIGASYKNVSAIDSGIDGTANSPEETGYDVGIQYDAGSMSLSATYLQAEMPLASGTAGDDEVNSFVLGATYVIGPGVELMGNVLWAEWNDEGTADADNNDGWGAITGIKVSF